jgi:CRP-like cAMP-binding protein
MGAVNAPRTPISNAIAVPIPARMQLRGASTPALTRARSSILDIQPTPARNRLLASLPSNVLTGLLPKLSPVTLARRQPIYAPDTVVEAVYFPTSGMFSLVANLDSGMQAEVGLIGREGMLGVSLLSEAETSFSECMVQMDGSALRMTARHFRHEIEINILFRTLLLNYSEAFQGQVMQTAACNGHHGLEQRFARWLLMAHDRAESDELFLTQDFLAMMLGVHRPSLTVTAGNLQRAELIRYAGGHITVLDRTGLEAATCECYGAVNRRFATLLGTEGTQPGATLRTQPLPLL